MSTIRRHIGRPVVFFDTTLRDGEQSPGISLNKAEKLEIAHQLVRLGVDVIEAGFPATSPGDFEAVQSIAREVKGAVICGLARCIESDIRTCWDAIKDAERPRIHTFVSTSDIHLRAPDPQDPRRGAADDQGDGRAVRVALSRTTSSSRPWTPPAPTWTSWRRCCRPPSTPAPPPSTCPTRWATRCPASTPR